MNGFVKTALATVASCAVIGFAHAGEEKSGDDKVLDACIRHFIASNLADYQGKITVRKETPIVSLPLSAIETKVVVSAAGAHGTEFGSAVCHVDRDGHVVSLTPVPGATKFSHVQPAKPVVVADAESH